ncbi:MAG: response regulator [Magnetococcales bacterium]|nr:response regulator [Magnetococcales bacterium]
MKILIVDDQFENRKLLRDILKKFGDCDLASNGEEAMEFFEADLDDGTPYDVVLLDIMMPGMDGQTALMKMRELENVRGIPSGKETKIIMVTAVDAPQQVIKAYFRGNCTDYLTKPITRKILLDKLLEHGLPLSEES